jgi:hypothetical protein
MPDGGPNPDEADECDGHTGELATGRSFPQYHGGEDYREERLRLDLD